MRNLLALSVTVLLLATLLAISGCQSLSRVSPTRPEIGPNGVQLPGVQLPALTETAVLTTAPEVPPPITRTEPALVKVALEAKEIEGTLAAGIKADTRYRFWTFNGTVPGPMVRVRQGDTVELTLTNAADSQMPHNIDMHFVNGPGGGADVTMAAPGQTKVARFQALNPGLYVYHCAMAPAPEHIANGMYGMILVEPKEGLAKVDREFYVMQSEFYTKEPFGFEGLTHFDPDKALNESPDYIVLNGKVGALLGGNALKANVGETVRIYFGSGGPNLTSSFHVIGEIFDDCYVQGSTGEPQHNVQTTSVPPGGSTMVQFKVNQPGSYSLVDHAIFRISKGCVGQLIVDPVTR